MKIRTISGLVALLFLVLILLHKVIFSLTVFCLIVIAMNELFKAFENLNLKPIKSVGYISCIMLFILALPIDIEKINLSNLLMVGVFVILMAIFGVVVVKNKDYGVVDISVTIFGILYLVYLGAFLILTIKLPSGFYFIWLILIGAIATDTFAYFSGVLFGKNKIIPAISPAKTIEGSLGG